MTTELFIFIGILLLIPAYIIIGDYIRRIQSKIPSRMTSTPMQAVWQIGPILDGKSKSINMPEKMTRNSEGLYFDFPNPNWSAGHVHYVVFNHGPLTGKTKIRMRYRIDADPSVQFLNDLGSLASVTLYFQRKGDRWTASQEYETYRWYSYEFQLLATGEHIFEMSFTDMWGAIMVSNMLTNPTAFRSAMENAQCVGFVLGGGTGRGHGVCATGPARFTLLDFQVL
jgi:hypothetical protein